MTERDTQSDKHSRSQLRSRKMLKITLIAITLLASCATVAFLTFYYRTSSPSDFIPHSASDEARIRKMVEEINAMGLTWKASYNSLAAISGSDEAYDPDLSSLKIEGVTLNESIRKSLVADTEAHIQELIDYTLANPGNITLPETFDAREQWQHCPSIRHIQNQGGCGSCWAAAATSMMADRLCIASNSTDQSMPSIEDLVSCCEFCGGCQGSRYSILPLLHLNRTGVVTGGGYGSNDSCLPYSIDSTCGVPCPPSFMTSDQTPKCTKQCRSGYSREYEADLIKARRVYWLSMTEPWDESDETNDAYNVLMRAIGHYRASELLMLDIFLHGPVILGLEVNESFMHYKSGIYSDPNLREINETLTYGHCMKVLGWGRERGQLYLTVANSWGRQWGEDGFGRLALNRFEHFDIVAALV